MNNAEAFFMREKHLCVVVTFHTTAEAMATELACKEHHITGKLISAPRALSADCGIAWCGSIDTRADLDRMFGTSKIEIAGIYEMEL